MDDSESSTGMSERLPFWEPRFVEYFRSDQVDHLDYTRVLLPYPISSSVQASRYMGVSKNYGMGWSAYIRDTRLGSYETEDEAALAYDHAAFRLRGRNAKLNFPNLDSRGELMSPDSPLTSYEKRVKRAAESKFSGSGLRWGAFGNDTGEHLSQSSKFIAPRENEESNTFQPFQHFPNVDIDWDAIMPQDCVAVGNQGDAAKELHVQDDGYAMNTETQSSNFQTEKSPPHQETKEIEEDQLMLDHMHQLPIVENSMQKKGLLVDAKEVDSYIHVVQQTCKDESLKEGKSSEKEYSYDILSAHFGERLDDVAKLFNVSRSKFKRICRDNGIKRWRSHKKKLDSQRSSKLGRHSAEDLGRTDSYCPGIPPLQDIDMITVKATYNEVAIKFEVLDSSGIVDLEDSVIERLKVGRDTFSIKYQDDEGDWLLIACDKDLQNCIKSSRLSKKTTIRMLVDRPVKHYAS